VAFGALNLDSVYLVERTLQDGEGLARPAGSFGGGSAANTIVALARLGLNTGVVGAVGEDVAGHTQLAELQVSGVDTSQVRIKDCASSGLTLCFSDPSGRRAIYIVSGANQLLERPDIPRAYLRGAVLVHCSSFLDEPQLAVQAACVRALPGRVRLSFSPGLPYAQRGIEALRPILERCEVVFLNREELATLTGGDTPIHSIQLRNAGAKAVVVTLGDGEMSARDLDTVQGALGQADQRLTAWAATGEGTSGVRAPRADVVDATGAGDAFAAGYLYALLGGHPPVRCLAVAQVLAEFSLRAVGARGSLPDTRSLAAACLERYRFSP